MSKIYCHKCSAVFDTAEGLQRHDYQRHGGKTWPDKGWLDRRIAEVQLWEMEKSGLVKFREEDD